MNRYDVRLARYYNFSVEAETQNEAIEVAKTNYYDYTGGLADDSEVTILGFTRSEDIRPRIADIMESLSRDIANTKEPDGLAILMGEMEDCMEAIRYYWDNTALEEICCQTTNTELFDLLKGD